MRNPPFLGPPVSEAAAAAKQLPTIVIGIGRNTPYNPVNGNVLAIGDGMKMRILLGGRESKRDHIIITITKAPLINSLATVPASGLRCTLSLRLRLRLRLHPRAPNRMPLPTRLLQRSATQQCKTERPDPSKTVDLVGSELNISGPNADEWELKRTQP